MSCEECRELLWEYLAQELTKEEADFVTSHLKECGDCQEDAKQLQKIMDSIKSLPEEELPQGYHEELMGKLAAEGKIVSLVPQKKPQYKWKQLGLIAAGVLLVAVFGGTQGILNMRGQKEITQKMAVGSEWDNQNFAESQNADQPEADLQIMQANDIAPEMRMAEQAEDAAPETQMAKQAESTEPEAQVAKQEKNNEPETQMAKQAESNVSEIQIDKQAEENITAQELPTKEKYSGEENPRMVQPKLSSGLMAESSMDEISDEVSPQPTQPEARGMLIEQNEALVVQQVILTVENKEGVLDKIRDLATSLGGYEGEQTVADGIKIVIPSNKTKEFVDGLKALGQTRSMKEPTENAESILFEVTLETK